MEPPSPHYTEEEMKAQRRKWLSCWWPVCERCSTCSLNPSPAENPARLTVSVSEGRRNRAQSPQSASLVYQPHASKSSPVPLNLSFRWGPSCLEPSVPSILPVLPGDLGPLGCHGNTSTTGKEADLQRGGDGGALPGDAKVGPSASTLYCVSRASCFLALSFSFTCRTFSAAAIGFSLPDSSLPCS